MLPNNWMQFIAVAKWTCCFLFLGFGSLFLMIYLLFTPYRWFPILYFFWYVYDYRTPQRGGRVVPWARSWRLWHHFRDYFPVRLIRSDDAAAVEFEPSRNFLFAYHPHGVMSMGAFCNFGTDASDFRRLFPGLTPRLLTLAGQYMFPLHREYLMMAGCCSCEKNSIDFLLGEPKAGNAVVLIVGGAPESLEARPDSLRLNLRSRKGFVKLAIRHGCPIVPVYGFGETAVYEQLANPPGSLLRRAQDALTRRLGFGVPVFFGRFGIFPRRRAITSVVGRPIEVPQAEHPTGSQVDAVHEAYVTQLCDLFERHKSRFGVPADRHLTIL